MVDYTLYQTFISGRIICDLGNPRQRGPYFFLNPQISEHNQTRHQDYFNEIEWEGYGDDYEFETGITVCKEYIEREVPEESHPPGTDKN